jgi:hypothetical protein
MWAKVARAVLTEPVVTTAKVLAEYMAVAELLVVSIPDRPAAQEQSELSGVLAEHTHLQTQVMFKHRCFY